VITSIRYTHTTSAAAFSCQLETAQRRIRGCDSLAQSSVCSSASLSFPPVFFQGFFLHFTRFCSGVGRVQHPLALSHPEQSPGRCPSLSWVSFLLGFFPSSSPEVQTRCTGLTPYAHAPVAQFLDRACRCLRTRSLAPIFFRDSYISMTLRRAHILLPTRFSYILFCALRCVYSLLS
jgi:hypothetical protein